MKKNLKSRTIFIVATILVCVFGIIGFPKSLADLKQNFSDNIRLGLDLKGGTYFVLEVQVQDAVKADADQTIERLKEDLKKENITWADMQSTDVKTVADAANEVITIKGIPATMSSAFRNVVSERYSTYNVKVLNSTDYQLQMKPTDLLSLESDTVKRTVETILNRINGLGLTEPTVTEYGSDTHEILVQLPGWTIRLA